MFCSRIRITEAIEGNTTEEGKGTGGKSEGEKESDGSADEEKARRLFMVRTVNHIHEPFDQKTQEIKVLLLVSFPYIASFFLT